MNDRFLCRFWNNKTRAYVNSNKLIYNDGSYTQVGKKQMADGHYHPYIVNEYNSDFIVQEQCTGLKDKNGPFRKFLLISVSKLSKNLMPVVRPLLISSNQ